MKLFRCTWDVARMILVLVAMMLSGCCGGGHGGYSGYPGRPMAPLGDDIHVSRVNPDWDPAHIVAHDRYPANVEPVIYEYRTMQPHAGSVHFEDMTTRSLWNSMNVQLVEFSNNKAVLIANNAVAVEIDPKPQHWCTVKLDGDARPRFIWLCNEDSEHWSPVLYSWSGESKLSVIELPLDARHLLPPLIVMGGRHAYFMRGGTGGPRPWLTFKSVPSVNGRQGAIYAEDEKGNRWDETIILPATRPAKESGKPLVIPYPAGRVNLQDARQQVWKSMESSFPVDLKPVAREQYKKNLPEYEVSDQEPWQSGGLQAFQSATDFPHYYLFYDGKYVGQVNEDIRQWIVADLDGSGKPVLVMHYSDTNDYHNSEDKVYLFSPRRGWQSDIIGLKQNFYLEQPDPSRVVLMRFGQPWREIRAKSPTDSPLPTDYIPKTEPDEPYGYFSITPSAPPSTMPAVSPATIPASKDAAPEGANK